MTRLTTSDLAAAGAAGLDTPEAGRFLRRIPVRLRTGGEAERAVVAPGTVLNTRFLARTMDATAAGAPEPAELGHFGDHLVLSLPVARKLRRVRLKTPQSGDQITAYRFDGQAVSDDPVKTATHGTFGARLDVTDASLILGRRNGADFALSPAAIDKVLLRYSPVNPRLSLRLADTPGSDVPLPVQTDPDGTPVFPAVGQHGAALAAALEAVLRGLPSPLPDPIELDLILSADQPCLARIDALDLSLVFEKRGFAGKKVLRFDGKRRAVQNVPLMMPAGAAVAGGHVTATVSGTPPAQIAQDDPAMPLPASSGAGIEVGNGTLVATRMDVAAALAVAAAEVLIAAPAGPAELRAVLLMDTAGQPGAALAESAARTVSTARPTAVTFVFAPTALPAGSIWLGLTARSGRAVALLGGAGPVARGAGSGFVILQNAQMRGIAAVLRPTAQPQTPTATGGPAVMVGETRLPGLPANGQAQLDLTQVLQTTPAPLSLSVSSAARAVVTIDPPLIRYGLT